MSILHKVTALVGIAEKMTVRPLSGTFERTYHIWADYDCSDHPECFMYRVKSIFMSECEQGKVDGVDLKQYENWFIDATILNIDLIRPETLQDYHKRNPGLVIYAN